MDIPEHAVLYLFKRKCFILSIHTFSVHVLFLWGGKIVWPSLIKIKMPLDSLLRKLVDLKNFQDIHIIYFELSCVCLCVHVSSEACILDVRSLHTCILTAQQVEPEVYLLR